MDVDLDLPGPSKPATLKLMGRIKKALDWYFFSTVTSATIVRLAELAGLCVE